MTHELEITKVNSGFTIDQVRDALRAGESLIKKDHMLRMNELRILGDVSFVAQMDDGIYLFSYYLFEQGRPEKSTSDS